jgi:hypothetical protein
MVAVRALWKMLQRNRIMRVHPDENQRFVGCGSAPFPTLSRARSTFDIAVFNILMKGIALIPDAFKILQDYVPRCGEPVPKVLRGHIRFRQLPFPACVLCLPI